MKKIVTILLLLVAGFGVYFLAVNLKSKAPENEVTPNPTTIKYVAIGDSYTIGNGVLEEDRWPNILVEHLKNSGVDITLVSNPAVSGYTVSDAISYELPILQRVKPDFVTVLIGANDNFRGDSVESFERDFKHLLDEIQKVLSKDKNLLLISIPDYTVSVAAKDYSLSQKQAQVKLIEQYNKVIQREAEKRGLDYVDIFNPSKIMTSADYYIDDGLHPSKKGYEVWEKEIFPKALRFFKK